MDVLAFIILMVYVIKCHGNTYLYFQEGDEKGEITIPFQCKRGLWQIDLNNDNTVDYNCSTTVENKTCDHKDFMLVEHKERKYVYQLKTNRSAIFGCVRNLTRPFIYPFNLSGDQLDSFVVALTKPEMVTAGSDVETQIIVTEQPEETLNLNCNFTLAGQYNRPISVYWIKITNEESTCIYSFSLVGYGAPQYNDQCPVEESLKKRMSNTSSAHEPGHNLKINQLTHSDSGQYVCALYILESEDKWYGKVIYNITVTVQDNRELNNTNQTTPDLTILYVVGGLLLMCLFVTVIVMRKKTKNSQAKHQTLRMNGNQDGAETLECSPYAVGRGDQDPHSRTKHPEVRDHVTLQNEADGHPSAELYSVVMISPEYEAIDNIGTQT